MTITEAFGNSNSYGVTYGLTPPRTFGLQLQYSFN